MKQVTEKADDVIAGNFEETSEEKDFNELDFYDLQMILQKRRKENSETVIFLAIVKWAKHDMDARQEYFDSLFLSVDISLLSETFIETKVLSEIVVAKSCSSLLRVSKELMSRIKLEKAYVPWRIGIVGGMNTQNDVVVFDPDVMETQQLPQIKFDLTIPVAARSDDNLYVINGSTSKMISLNLKDQKYNWVNVTTMPEPKREAFGCFAMKGVFYVVGGKSGGKCLSSVIKYDLSKNVWSDVKSMNEERKNHALVSLEDKLYAIAGNNGEYLRTVEKYDAINNDWTYVSSLNKERENLSATVFNRRIYATGGYNGSDLPNVEMYVPNEHIWIMIKELKTPRYRHGSCVVDGQMYVVGGWKVTSIEVFDRNKNEWKICGNLDKKRNYSAVCAM